MRRIVKWVVLTAASAAAAALGYRLIDKCKETICTEKTAETRKEAA